jgi:hypothetical protein
MIDAPSIPSTGSRLSKRAAALAAVAASFVTLVAGLALSAPAATAAAPGWELLAVTAPTNLPPTTAEVQTVTVFGGSGTFTLSFDSQVTDPVAFDATAAEVEAALDALPAIDGAVEVSGGSGAYRVKFAGVFSGVDVSEMVAAGSALAFVSTATPGGAGRGDIGIAAVNVGGQATTGTHTFTIELPEGLETSATPRSGDNPSLAPDLACSPTGAGHRSVSCSRSMQFPVGRTSALIVPVSVSAPEGSDLTVEVTVSGGGAAVAKTDELAFRVSDTPAPAGIQAAWAGAFDENGNPETRAGAHPALAAAYFFLNTKLSVNGTVIPVAPVRNLITDLPTGFVGNPLVTPRCLRSRTTELTGCLADADVGFAGPLLGEGSTYTLNGYSALEPGAGFEPVKNILPPHGSAAQFTFKVVTASGNVLGRVRPDDFGARALAPNIVSSVGRVYGALFGIHGFPAGGGGKPFFTNPTDCPGVDLSTVLSADSWYETGVFSDPLAAPAPAVTGCEDVPFDPTLSVTPTSTTRDSASGLDFDLDLPQEALLEADGIATSHLKDVEVDLPQGLAVNPSGATGLDGCSDAEMAVGTGSVPGCPDGSKIGTVRATSPLVDQEVGGALYLADPKSTDPASGEMFRLFVVARNDQLGIMVKLPGSATADPATGRLHARFENNPKLPFDHLEVELKGGDRGVLATPRDCGPISAATTLVPWSGNAAAERSTETAIGGDCAQRFAPVLDAGNSDGRARGQGGTFSFRFSRQDGEQWLRGVTATLPKGLLADIGDVPLCSSAAADAGACPADSKIGIVDAKAGSGDPFVLEEKGEVFLTEGYKGGPYGLAVKIRPVAGPFRGAMELSPIVVRQAIHVDPTTAEVTAVSDPFPLIHHGIPLRVREVTVLLDRGGFMLNPSNCTQTQTAATMVSDTGATASVADPFGVSGCAALPFKPKLGLRLTGRKQTRTGRHPGVKATVTQKGVSEAGIEKTVVRLPKSLALDPDNAQALCEFDDGAKPDLENHCPKGSIVGRARAKTPLLKNDLAGNVYFVKNVRRDPTTGNAIRTLPMLIVALRGEIAVNLKGESSTTRAGRLVNTFASVPDAPITRFNLNIEGGRNGILAVTRTRRAAINLCAGSHIAETEMDGHNGRRYDRDIRMKTPCKRVKKNSAAMKRKAAAKRRAARR